MPGSLLGSKGKQRFIKQNPDHRKPTEHGGWEYSHSMRYRVRESSYRTAREKALN